MVGNSAESFLLLNPGPVPITDAVRKAMDEPMISHRSSAFESAFERSTFGLNYIFTRSSLDGSETARNGTSLVLNGTATMGMEAAIANLVDADSHVVTLENGKFGNRFAEIADRYCEVDSVQSEWGTSFAIDAVASAITDETDVVAMVHNETSTGILNPVKEIGKIAAEHDAIFIVDGVTSVGGDEFLIDEWNVDIVITDSQKALAAPPGVSALFVTERAANSFDGENAPYYEDLEWHLEKAKQNQTPFTGAVPLIKALAVAVEQIVDETMPTRIRRHRRQAAAFREGFREMGLSTFPDISGPSRPSNTVTAISIPRTLQSANRSNEFFEAVREENVSISGGQGHLGGTIFRVSNMGNHDDSDILRGIETVGNAFIHTGIDVDIESGIEAAIDRLSS